MRRTRRGIESCYVCGGELPRWSGGFAIDGYVSSDETPTREFLAENGYGHLTQYVTHVHCESHFYWAHGKRLREVERRARHVDWTVGNIMCPTKEQ